MDRDYGTQVGEEEFKSFIKCWWFKICTIKNAQLNLTRFSISEINEMTHNLRDLCGEGQYAKVYRGELNSEEVAVKVYPRDREELAKNEMEAMSVFGSRPNIIPVRGTCVDEKYYVVMKFVPNNLQQLIEASELKRPETLQILKQLARAINGVITADYVIADIKPDNILIDEDQQLYLCDFGSAKRGGRQLPTFNKLYTPKEVVLSGNGSLKSDIYNVGAILLQMTVKYNNFERRDYSRPMEDEVRNITAMSVRKKDKKGAKSSKCQNPNVVIQARVDMLLHSRGHVVDKSLLQSGCDENDAQRITQLGLQCTNDEENKRPSMQHIMSTLEDLKIRRPRP